MPVRASVFLPNASRRIVASERAARTVRCRGSPVGPGGDDIYTSLYSGLPEVFGQTVQIYPECPKLCFLEAGALECEAVQRPH